MYDLVIRGGTVVDPSQGINGRADVAIADGVVREVAPGIRTAARRDLDASGLIVTPGLVDIHIHAYQHVSHYGIDPDQTCLATGVTTAVDAGTAGRCIWPGLRHYVLDRCRTRTYAFLHISGMGMLTDSVGEGQDLRWLDVAAADAIASENRDRVLGIKVRQDVNRVGDSGVEPLRRAVLAGERLNLPVMVHIGKTPAPLAELAGMMRPGDIITHCFHGWEEGVLDENGTVIPELRRAAQRGIIFDVGHGAGSFSFPVTEAALAQDFLPDTISTDLHTYSLNGPVYDLPSVMAKFQLMGLSLEEVVRKTTVDAARAVGLSHQAGSLAEGRPADVTVLQEISGDFRFDDCFGNARHAQRTLVPRWVVLGGEVLPARSAAPWR